MYSLKKGLESLDNDSFVLKTRPDMLISYNLIKKKVKNLKINYLQDKNLLSDDVAVSASVIARDKKIRKIVKNWVTNI